MHNFAGMWFLADVMLTKIEIPYWNKKRGPVMDHTGRQHRARFLFATQHCCDES